MVFRRVGIFLRQDRWFHQRVFVVYPWVFTKQRIIAPFIICEAEGGYLLSTSSFWNMDVRRLCELCILAQ